ncbi:MAG: hypothetical protein AAF456_25530 [Planctomycetota bacterium]
MIRFRIIFTNILAPILLGVLLTQTGAAQTAEELFDSMLESQGSEYTEARDRFLQAPDTELLHARLDGTPEEWIQATILSGWVEHEARYRELINTPTTTSRGLEEHYPWALREMLDRFAAPLLVEILLKGGNHENADDDAADSLRKMVHSGMALDARLFTIPLRRGDIETKHHLASVVSAFPPTENEELFNELDDIFRSEEDVTTGRLLLHGLVNQSSLVPEDRRAAFVAELSDKATLDRLGQRAIYSALADIGGEAAESVLLEYFDRAITSGDAFEQRDAVQTLFKIPVQQSVDRLLIAAGDSGRPEWMRKMIHNHLGSVPYEDRIKIHLMGVVANDDLSTDERAEAVSALGRIQVDLSRRGVETDDITGTFGGILESGIEDPEFLKMISDSYQNGLRIDR